VAGINEGLRLKTRSSGSKDGTGVKKRWQECAYSHYPVPCHRGDQTSHQAGRMDVASHEKSCQHQETHLSGSSSSVADSSRQQLLEQQLAVGASGSRLHPGPECSSRTQCHCHRRRLRHVRISGGGRLFQGYIRIDRGLIQGYSGSCGELGKVDFESKSSGPSLGCCFNVTES